MKKENSKLSLKLKIDKLNSKDIDSTLMASLIERAKSHFKEQEEQGTLAQGSSVEIGVQFDKDPHDRDPHDRANPHDRDNFSRDNFSRYI
jgi:hypothetical protein